MDLERIGRSVVLTAALSILGGGVAAAQTVILRKAPPGSTVEVVLNSSAVGSRTVDLNGDGRVPIDLQGTLKKSEIDAYLFIDVCGTTRRVLIVERGQQVPPRADGCERFDLPGLFLVRRVSSLVFFVGEASPTVLLRQGSYSLKPPRVWKPAPTGLVVFGGVGYGRFRDASAIACGNLTDCSGSDSGILFNAGATYWLWKFVGAEISYMRPAEAKTTFTGDTFSFDTVLDAELLNISGKIGVPIGPTRIYGNIGTNYHRALHRTTQRSGSITDVFDVRTEGWGWMWGAGFEAWLTSAFALYGEAGSVGFKGNSTNVPDGQIDERVNFAVGGIRIRIGK
jgi:hypothetical protein